MDVLEKLFGNPVRVRVMVFFLNGRGGIFDVTDIVKRTRIAQPKVRKELVALEKIGMLIKRDFIKEEHKTVKTRKKSEPVKIKITKKKAVGFELNPEFIYQNALRHLLITSNPVDEKRLLARLSDGGKLQVVIVAGTLLHAWDEGRVDLLIVGDKLKNSIIEHTVKTFESELGKELRCAIFETNDFEYRLSVCDRLIRDILENPHKRLLDRLNVPETDTTTIHTVR